VPSWLCFQYGSDSVAPLGGIIRNGALQKGAQSSGRITLKSLAAPELKMVSGTWSAAPDYRPVVAFPPQQALPVRSLMPNIPTSSALVEFLVETSFTNNAG